MSVRHALSLAGVAGCVLAAAPAAAQDDLNYSLVARSPALCTITGDVYASSDTPATAIAVNAGDSATATLDLTQAGQQEIGQVGALCNGGSATITIATTNGFRLFNQGGGANREIPYTISVLGTPVNNATSQASYVENDISGASRRVISIAVGELDFLLLAAGEYSDTVTLSVTPNS